MSTFKLLHEKVQKYIYKQKWPSFRPIQDEAIQSVLCDKCHLLICAPTASGKTEAAFLPIISSVAENYSESIKAIYISPLKALINDQFKRIDSICDDMGIPVTKWHGDVGQSSKNKITKHPSGILLITPESLEALLLHRPLQVREAFSKLEWIVIDEIHSFIGVERGAQLLSLLARIEDEIKSKPRRIGLSATIGNPENVAKWISPDHCKIISDNDWNDSGVEGIIKSSIIKKDHELNDEIVISPGVGDLIYNSFQHGKNLIFGNSKSLLEQTCDVVSSKANRDNSFATFLIHHGSLSKNTRENTEDKIKKSEHSVSVFCTSTLEMGIDIGAIEKIGLIDPPWSVSSFAQRIGRSGRREGSNKKFEFYITQEEITGNISLTESFREDLIKSIAIVLLYLEDFKEPLNTNKMHLSTMAHQILSLSVQKSGISYVNLQNIILKSAFQNTLNENDFKKLISHLIEKKLIHLDSYGLISAGAIGEKLVEHYEFYSVFQSSEQWSVLFNGDLVGQIPMTCNYQKGDRILLGARRWDIIEVNDASKKIIVIPGKKAKVPIFKASYGITNRMIHQKMKEIYESDEEYVFLDITSLTLLKEARKLFNEKYKQAQKSIETFQIFEGSVIQNTISIALKDLKISFAISECFLEIESNKQTWKEELKQYLANTSVAEKLCQNLSREAKLIEKYDHFLPDDLLEKSYIESRIDLSGALAWISSL